MHSCEYIYIYIYIYMYMYVGLCVCSWIIGEESILSSASFERHHIVWKIVLCLSILAWRPHKELCPREPTWTCKGPILKVGVEETKDVGQFSQRLEAEETSWKGSRSVRRQYEVSKSDGQAENKVWVQRWVGIFGSCLSFSQSSRDSHTHTHTHT